MSEHHEIVKRIDEFYSVISGTVEEERDWESFKSIFSHDAKLKPIRKNGRRSRSSNYSYWIGYSNHIVLIAEK